MGINILNNGADFSANKYPRQWATGNNVLSKAKLFLRPQGAEGSLIDLSRFDSKYTPKGTLVFSPYGLRGDNNNGIVTTAVSTTDHTMFAICRLVTTTNWSTGGELWAGGTFANPAGTLDDKGAAIGFTVGAPSAGNVIINGRFRTVMTSKNPRVVDIPLALTIPVTQFTTDYYMLAVSITGTTEQIITQLCGTSSTIAPRTEVAGELSNRPVGSFINVATVPYGNTQPANAVIEVTEFYYGALLTQAELDDHYTKVKAEMAINGLTLR